jgi:hypothetical protein
MSLLGKEETFLFQLFQLFFQHIPSTPILYIFIYIISLLSRLEIIGPEKAWI